MVEISQSPSSLRERKTARTRQSLIEAAFARFDRQGFEGTTVDEIAADAEVSRPTFFRYFPCKEAVVFPNAEIWMKRLLDWVQSGEADDTPLSTLRRACTALSQLLEASRDELMQQRELVKSSPALAAYEKQVDARWVEVVQACLSRGEPTPGDLQRQTRIFAAAATAAFIATIQEWLDAGGSSDLALEGQKTLDILEQGLGRTIPHLTGSTPASE